MTEGKFDFKIGPWAFMSLSLLIWGFLVGLVTDGWKAWLGWMLLYLVSDILMFLVMWGLAYSSMKKENK